MEGSSGFPKVICLRWMSVGFRPPASQSFTRTVPVNIGPKRCPGEWVQIRVDSNYPTRSAMDSSVKNTEEYDSHQGRFLIKIHCTLIRSPPTMQLEQNGCSFNVTVLPWPCSFSACPASGPKCLQVSNRTTGHHLTHCSSTKTTQ